MFILSITPGQIAGSVWTNVTRTLTTDPATDAGAATLVWTHATRTVTSLAAAMTGVGNANQSVNAGAVLDLRPAAGKFRLLQMTVPSGTGPYPGTYDGVTFQAGATAIQQWPGCGYSSIGPAYKNTTAGALPAAYAGFDIG